MRILILTSSRRGTAAWCLPYLLEHTDAEIVQVILNQGVIRNRWAHYKKKWKKMLRIGPGGAINGIRMRRWYSIQSVDGKPIEDIEVICKKNNIPFATTEGINTPGTIALVAGCHADLGLSLGNSYISSKVFTLPKYGMLNIHGEELPAFQNAQSVIWQLYEGSAMTGYTIHEVDKKIDTGRILKQERFPILFRDTLGETVNASCAEILKRAAAGLSDVLRDFKTHRDNGKEQGPGRSYTTPSLRQFRRITSNFKRLRGQALTEPKKI